MIDALESTRSVSVIVACAGQRDHPLATLQALLDQEYPAPLEVLLVTPDSLVVEFPEDPRVRRISSESSSIPALRAAGWAAATGRYVGVLACYCVPERGWVATAVRLLESHASLKAVGGPIRHTQRSGADMAGLLCEYGQIRFPGAGEIRRMPLPGLNVLYRRATLEGVERSELAGQFWEELVHPLLEFDQYRVDPGLAVTLTRHFDLSWYSRQRFLYSRHFAGRRFHGNPARRWLYRLSVPLLPAVLLTRVLTRDRLLAMRQFPYVFWFVLVWTAGELVGAWAGPGDAVERVE